jgi:hypothetical protein
MDRSAEPEPPTCSLPGADSGSLHLEAAEREKIREAHRQVDASRAEFNVERAVHATKVEALRADREQLERSRSAHE